MFPRRVLRILFLLLLSAGLASSVSYAVWRISRSGGFTEIETTGRHRLDLYETSLQREIEKYRYFATTLGLQTDVINLIQSGGEELADRVNTYLEQLNGRAGTLVIYIMNTRGIVLASSNIHRQDSYIGEDLSFRPYFGEAVKSGQGRFFGIGTTRGEPGYFLSSALIDKNHLVGVAVIKVSLEQLEEFWSTVEEPVLVADENNIVILSSVKDWKFTALRPIDDDIRKVFDRTQQYNRRILQPFGMTEIGSLAQGVRQVRIKQNRSEMIPGSSVAGEFLAQSRPLHNMPWTMTVFSRLDQLDKISANRAVVAGITTVFMCILVLMIIQRRRHLRDRMTDKKKLQTVYDELEKKIQERTADLFMTNRTLRDKITERLQAEETLRATQDELIQSGKLAVIGQLSAGIAHELNQPLAALRTLSGNTQRYLEHGNVETVRSNLDRMIQIVDRMGKIVGRLRTFAHKSSGRLEPVNVHLVVTHAIALLDQRVATINDCTIINSVEEELCASCDANRLEQVMVNLIGNALDATSEKTDALVEISSSTNTDCIFLHVRDNGTGLHDDVRKRLFEPFFTTKDSGLGLGLVISAGIVNDFGGTLTGTNHPDGGSVFTVEIPRVPRGSYHA